MKLRTTRQMKNIVCIVMFMLTIGVAGQDKYMFPMDIKPLMSASFAELRANHFHAGLDMSTSGVIGIEVRAVADGYVSRIKVSPYGYGYALYLTHPDGRTTVYGHLSAYSKEIDEIVTAEQYRRKSFEVDMMLKPGRVPVKRGQVVAYSGNTGGSGGPHLHFEVRDTETEYALNPLKYLEPITDMQAPTVYGLKLYGLTDDAQVSGRCQDKYMPIEEIENKSISVCGKIGVGVHAVDYFVAGQRPCGVCEIRLYDNDKLIFNSLLDSVSFDLTRYINSHIDYAERQTTKRFVQKSFVEENNPMTIYHSVHDLYVKSGEVHNMRYELMDFNGNRRVVKFVLKGAANPSAAPRKHNGELVEWNRTWAKDTLGMSVVIGHGCLYRDEYIVVDGLQLSDNNSVYVVGSESIGLQKAVTLTLPIDDKQKALGRQLVVGHMDDKGKMTYVGGNISGDYIVAKSKVLGRFALCVDSVAPKVVTKNTRTVLKPGNSVMIGISDNFSGIKKYNVYIDGDWKCFEYDYKNARLINKVSRLGLSTGHHDLEAVIEDECGNVSRWNWSFSVVSQ